MIPSQAERRIPGTTARLGVLAVLAVAVAFRLFGVHENLLYDPLAYAQYAYNLAHGSFALKDNYAFAHRLPVVAPVALSYSIFGLGALPSVLWLHLLALAQVGFVILLGMRLLDRTTGLLAGLLLAIAPLDVIYANFLTPDLVLAAFCTGAVGSWLLGTEGSPPGAGTRWLWCSLSGPFLVLAVLTRMYAGILLVFFAVHWIWRRRGWSAPLAAIAGAAVAVLPMAWLYARETGNALYPIAVQPSSFGGQVVPHGLQLHYYFWHLLHPRSQAGLFGALWLGTTAYSLVRPNRERLLLLLWIVPLFLYLQFGSMSLTAYQPVWKTIRYLTPLFAPFSLLAASLLVGFGRGDVLGGLTRWRPLATRATRVRLVTALVALLALQSVWVVAKDRETHRRTSESFLGAVALLRADPERPVLCDHWRTGLALSYYFRFEEGSQFYRDAADSLRIGQPGRFGDSRLGYLAWYAAPTRVPDAFAVLDDGVLTMARRAGSPPARYLGVVMPAYAFDPPGSWRLVYRRDRLRIYRTGPPAAALPDSGAVLEAAPLSR